MKLATFRTPLGEHPRFGVLLDDRLHAFTDLDPGAAEHGLATVGDYLAGLPGTFDRAYALSQHQPAGGILADEVRLLPAVPHPAALLDCGLSPRHLRASTATLLRHALPLGLGHVAGSVAGAALGKPRSGVRFYKGNHLSISGDHDTVDWPDYTHYLDIEPELAIVTGPLPQRSDPTRIEQALAGYVIYNDVSARDVQLPEMVFTGPTSSKDFDTGNGLGPFLVTPDEVPDPLNLTVAVDITGRAPWRGTTADYSHHPREVLGQITTRRSLSAGTLVGMGAVPGCCGLDRDEWLNPGDDVTITIENLGTLHQHLGHPTGTPTTPWTARLNPVHSRLDHFTNELGLKPGMRS
jgi:2-keto-4-pentenoate hydratase/2-oxohepta-3-ene-1,7-dioic acid hydratase in catechol pathway